MKVGMTKNQDQFPVLFPKGRHCPLCSAFYPRAISYTWPPHRAYAEGSLTSAQVQLLRGILAVAFPILTAQASEFFKNSFLGMPLDLGVRSQDAWSCDSEEPAKC